MKTKKIIDKNSFMKLLWWYKKPWYNNTNFTSDMQGKEIQDLIEALNIKNYNKRVEFIYDRTCQRLDEYYNEKNICEFCDGKCLFQQKGYLKDFNGCCRLCRYQSEKGCTTSNLTCKLYYCGLIRDTKQTLYFKDMKLLKLYTLRQRIMCFDNFYASREQSLYDLKMGLIILYSFHATFRSIKNYWFVNHNKLYKKES